MSPPTSASSGTTEVRGHVLSKVYGTLNDVTGHFIPSKANWRNFFKAYLKDPLGDIPSPGTATASQPASGTATPVQNDAPRL